MRLPWVVGNLGGLRATLLVALCIAVSLLTTFSMSGVCTNGRLGGGGAYYVISRSLGPAWGGSIGFLFFLANAVSVAMYVSGFIEVLRTIVTIDITGTLLNDNRIIGSGITAVWLGIVLLGVKIVVKADFTFFVIMTATMVNLFIGCIMNFDMDKLRQNTLPELGGDFVAFDRCFAVFFPAVTGIMAGANISASLKDPQKDIPKGTLLTIYVQIGIYVLLTWFATACFTRDVAVNLESFVFSEVALWKPLIYAGIFSSTTSAGLSSFIGAPRILQALCVDGLIPFLNIFGRGHGKDNSPVFGTLLTFAIAMVCVLIGGINAIAPLISILFLLTYALINFACFQAFLSKAPSFRPSFKLSNIYIAFVGTIFCVAVMLYMNYILTLVGLALFSALWLYITVSAGEPKTLTHEEALAAVRSAHTGLAREALVNRERRGQWGDMIRAARITTMLRTLRSLERGKTEIDGELYRPNMIVFTGRPNFRPHLVNFASMLCRKGNGLLMAGDVIPIERGPEFLNDLAAENDLVATSLVEHTSSRMFYMASPANDLEVGVTGLLTTAGIGPIKPNAAMFGFVTDWVKDVPAPGTGFIQKDHSKGRRFVSLLQKVVMCEMSLVVVRNLDPLFSKFPIPDTLFSDPMDIGAVEEIRRRLLCCSRAAAPEAATVEEEKSASDAPSASVSASVTSAAKPAETPKKFSEKNLLRRFNNPSPLDEEGGGFSFAQRKLARDRLENVDVQRFPELRYPHIMNPVDGRIDVFWLVEDGGFTALMPFLLSKHHAWKGSHLRFLVSSHPMQAKLAASSMHTLLGALRIKASVAEIPHAKLVDPQVLREQMHMEKPLENKDAQLKRIHEAAARIDNGSFTLLPPSVVSPPMRADDSRSSSDGSPGVRDSGWSHLASHSRIRHAHDDLTRGGAASPRQSTVFDMFQRPAASSRSDSASSETDAYALSNEHDARDVLDEWRAQAFHMGAVFRANDASVCLALQMRFGVAVPEELHAYVARFVRLNAVMRLFCRDSKIVFVTLPVPRLSIQPELLMTLYDVISDLPGVPVVLIRGNGRSVLTAAA
eukprot:gnl/Chilomastix_cuspidata/1261.p1 GENE.gnl/Chilomastix_cuspidata/1261~~gnl/Chilomastix_cuspidata/1261.p1  ORF type:complete len:1146 (+),score=347.50 gnl/Chilomastix_cuspidata/1261:257-3439(+)